MISESKKKKNARRAMIVRMHHHLCMKWITEHQPEVRKLMWEQAKHIIGEYEKDAEGPAAKDEPKVS